MLNDKRNNKNAGTTKTIVFFTSIIVALSSILLVSYYLTTNNCSNIEQEIQTLETELNNSINTLYTSIDELDELHSKTTRYQERLYENNTKLQTLTAGNELQLHNPTRNEAINFINSDNNEYVETIIKNAKSQGIHCLYVEVRVSFGTYNIVGFDTIDEGMIYFEPITDYILTPEIGKAYISCFEEQVYTIGICDTIKDILIYF